MKAIYLAITAAAAALLLSACQRNELGGGSLSGEEVTIGISAVMPLDGGAVVKSDAEPGDASEINRCIMGVYLNDAGMESPAKIGDTVVVKVDPVTHKAEFEDLQLVAGHTYQLIFWADCASGSSDEGLTDQYYSTESFPEVSFKTGVTYAGNDDSRDAFFATQSIKVDGPKDYSVKLYRPFGQLNIIATDYEIVEDNFSTLLPTTVKIEFANIPSGINLLTGDLTEAVQQTLTSGPVAIANVTPAATDGSRQLSFDYIFAPQGDDQQLVLEDFKMFFLDNAGAEKVSHYIFQNIPVKRNYQTNVSGALLTDRTGIDIEVVPEFDGLLPEEVNDAETLIAALQNGGYVKFTSDITITDATIAPAGTPINIDLGGHTLTFESDVASLEAYNSTITISGGVVEAMNIPKTTGNAVNDLLHVLDNGTIILDEVTLRTSAGGVGVNGGIENGEVVIRNSEIDVAAYALSTNASAVPENLQIELENSSFKGSTAVMINVPCTLRMNYCDVMGKNAAAFLMRGGNATIQNSTITLNYTDGDGETIGDYFQDLEWGTGNMVNVAALTAGNKKQGSYQYSTTIDMKNTVVEVAGPYADYLPAMYVNANQGEGLGVTITYDDECEIIGGIEIGSDNVTVNGAEMTSASQIVYASDSQTLAEAFANMGTEAGQTQHLQVTLSGNIDLSQVAFQDVPAGTSVSMDLSDYTATLPKRNLLTSGALSLRNGNLSDPSGAGIGCLSGGSVSLDEVQYDAEGWGCIFVTQNAKIPISPSRTQLSTAGTTL